jgi:hypothetical protein
MTLAYQTFLQDRSVLTAEEVAATLPARVEAVAVEQGVEETVQPRAVLAQVRPKSRKTFDTMYLVVEMRTSRRWGLAWQMCGQRLSRSIVLLLTGYT